MSDLCPICKTKLVTASGIAVYCPNDNCPVFDDADLWSWENGEPVLREGPTITHIKDAKDLEIQSLQQQVKEERNKAIDECIAEAEKVSDKIYERDYFEYPEFKEDASSGIDKVIDNLNKLRKE